MPSSVSDHRAVLLVELVVLLGHEAVDDLVDLAVEVGVVLGRARDDERRARLVDEDGVDLVDDGEVELALHVVLQAELHVVAQVVEAELVVLPVGDVGAVGVLALRVGELVAGRSPSSCPGSW